ncbi:MAG: hypothetical protein JSR82_17015 [Verrucomicrobia bacterium]|nr:hypothetical protein [Verrucomicrobiota bacterium]
MKRVFLSLLCLATVAASDTYPVLKTNNGTEYRNARVSGVEPDGITIFHAGGVAKILFRELPNALQEKYGYNAAAAAKAEAADRAAQAAIAVQAQQDAATAAKARLEQEKQQAQAMREAERKRMAGGGVGGASAALKPNETALTYEERKRLEREIAAGRIVRQVRREEDAKDRAAVREERKRIKEEEKEEAEAK